MPHKTIKNQHIKKKLTAAALSGIALGALSFSSPAAAQAAPETLLTQKYMLNWGPGRDRLADDGVKFDFFYVVDALDNVEHPKGTKNEFNTWNRIRGTVDIDFGKFTSLQGLTYHATGLWQTGQNMGSPQYTGTIANPSGLVSIHTFRLDSMWLQQEAFGGVLTMTAGQMASQDFYGLQDLGGNFVMEPLNYAFGNLGNVRASWDPASGPAGQIKVAPNDSFFIKGGYFMPRNYSDDGFNYKEDKGLDHTGTWNVEVGYNTDPNAPATRKSYPGILHAGLIYNEGKFVDYDKPLVGGNLQTSKSNYLVYFMATQPVLRLAAGSNRGLDLTFGVNTGPDKKSEVPTEITFGASFNGPAASRPKDVVSFGFVYSQISDKYNDYMRRIGSPTLTDEKAFEINYLAQLTPWLMVQPVFQYYMNAGGRDGSDVDAAVGGFRLKATF
ncbi:MAG: carbohydrate porin [Telmatospirillum sp.]|nr:carbohydrate porin [Telmatospirillum sp.]